MLGRGCADQARPPANASAASAPRSSSTIARDPTTARSRALRAPFRLNRPHSPRQDHRRREGHCRDPGRHQPASPQITAAPWNRSPEESRMPADEPERRAAAAALERQIQNLDAALRDQIDIARAALPTLPPDVAATLVRAMSNLNDALVEVLDKAKKHAQEAR